MAPTVELPGFLGTLAPLLDRYGYLAVAGIVSVESFGVPAPGQTILITAAVYAGAGRLNIAAVAAIGLLAAILGDNIGYLIGRTGGRRLILRYGRYVRLTPERVTKPKDSSPAKARKSSSRPASSTGYANSTASSPASPR